MGVPQTWKKDVAITTSEVSLNLIGNTTVTFFGCQAHTFHASNTNPYSDHDAVNYRKRGKDALSVKVIRNNLSTVFCKIPV